MHSGLQSPFCCNAEAGCAQEGRPSGFSPQSTAVSSLSPLALQMGTSSTHARRGQCGGPRPGPEARSVGCPDLCCMARHPGRGTIEMSMGFPPKSLPKAALRLLNGHRCSGLENQVCLPCVTAPLQWSFQEAVTRKAPGVRPACFVMGQLPSLKFCKVHRLASHTGDLTP